MSKERKVVQTTLTTDEYEMLVDFLLLKKRVQRIE
jgi:hypothetical protein